MRHEHVAWSLRRALAKVCASICAIITVMAWWGPAYADDLTQVIDPNQGQGSGRVVIRAGHVDMGPTLETGAWKIQLHDDTGEVSYWRMPEDVVFSLSDEAIIPMPDNSTYQFLEEKPGTPLWVIPQTQEDHVPWLGWNTQDPALLSRLKDGMRLSLDGVQGPGRVDVYLENGDLQPPQQIWSTTRAYPQPTWIETNAHTHVNWVFHRPGVYLLRFTASGTLTDGTVERNTALLRFAVGDATDPQAAFDARYRESDHANSAKKEATQNNDAANSTRDSGDEHDGLLYWVWVLVVIFGVICMVFAVVVALAGRRAKARYMRAHEQTLRQAAHDRPSNQSDTSSSEQPLHSKRGIWHQGEESHHE